MTVLTNFWPSPCCSQQLSFLAFLELFLPTAWARLKISQHLGIFFFRRDIWGNFCNMANILTCRCPNRSGVGAIDSPDLFEQVLDQRCIPEVSEKIFTHDISMIRRQKMVIFGVLKVFISNFTYYNLY